MRFEQNLFRLRYSKFKAKRSQITLTRDIFDPVFSMNEFSINEISPQKLNQVI